MPSPNFRVYIYTRLVVEKDSGTKFRETFAEDGRMLCDSREGGEEEHRSYYLLVAEGVFDPSLRFLFPPPLFIPRNVKRGQTRDFGFNWLESREIRICR